MDIATSIRQIGIGSFPDQELRKKLDNLWLLKNKIEEKIHEKEQNNMPYIPSRERRDQLNLGAQADTEGERTYLHYRYFVQEWHKAPKFSTAFRLQKEVHQVALNEDDQAAKELAFDEFKRRYLHPHEQAQMVKNGDIYP